MAVWIAHGILLIFADRGSVIGTKKNMNKSNLSQKERNCFSQIELSGCLCDYNTHSVIVAGTAYFDACELVIQQFPKSIVNSLIEKGLVKEVGEGIYQAGTKAQ